MSRITATDNIHDFSAHDVDNYDLIKNWVRIQDNDATLHISDFLHGLKREYFLALLQRNFLNILEKMHHTVLSVWRQIHHNYRMHNEIKD